MFRASLLSKRRGKPSNHRLSLEVRRLALSIVRARYVDFGPTFAAEKLAELHGCLVSRETLRGWMIEDGLWFDRRLANRHGNTRRAIWRAGSDQPRRAHRTAGRLPRSTHEVQRQRALQVGALSRR